MLRGASTQMIGKRTGRKVTDPRKAEASRRRDRRRSCRIRGDEANYTLRDRNKFVNFQLHFINTYSSLCNSLYNLGKVNRNYFCVLYVIIQKLF